MPTWIDDARRALGAGMTLALLAASLAPMAAADAPRLAEADLPTVEVPQRPAHSVPDPPSPTRPATSPSRSDLQPPRPPPAAATRPASPQLHGAITIAGAARIGDAMSLTVLGRKVPLFGISATRRGDRCQSAIAESPRSCDEVAREALAGRLRTNTFVSCRVPPGQPRGAGAAVCLDATGVDLAGFLAGQGLALADRAQSYDYVGAEGVARSLRRGLWRYR